MTKMNWERVRREQQFARAERFTKPFGMGRKPHPTPHPIGFPAKWSGHCANCRAEFPAGTMVKFNKDDKIVHGRGCPKKPKNPKPAVAKMSWQDQALAEF